MLIFHMRKTRGTWLGILAALLFLAGCSLPTTNRSAAPQNAGNVSASKVASRPNPLPPAPVPFEQAILNAANGVFSTLPNDGTRHLVVIDPLIDGVTGNQTVVTRNIQGLIANVARERYPHVDIQPLSSANINKAPIVMIGTFTPVEEITSSSPSPRRRAVPHSMTPIVSAWCSPI